MLTVQQVSRRTGVSIRTLQYYDNIGLLKATAHTEAGYRLYGPGALERLEQILLFRELEFPLKQIRQILDSPDFDRQKALQQQLALLRLKRERLDRLITLTRELIETGGTTMDFSAFDTAELEEYSRQARQQWGHTPQYAEAEEKDRTRSPQEKAALGRNLMAQFARMGQIRHEDPGSAQAQAMVAQLQDYITTHYYRCSDNILLGLGQMYTSVPSFTANIDAAGGPGTAAFANAAIKIYCGK